VLDLFAVPGDVQPLAGGAGHSVRAGDLVLSPGRDPAVLAWLAPVLARLAVRLDERSDRALRIAMPIPARDGSWVVDGWGASRYEPGTTASRDLPVLVAAGRLLHAELAVAVPRRPSELDLRDDRWARAERFPFDEAALVDSAPKEPRLRDLVRRLAGRLTGRLTGTALGAEQLVHVDLAVNVLLDAHGAPVVIDLSPAWRPPRWAEAVCVLDAVLWHGAPAGALARWRSEAEVDALVRAALFRLLSDDPPDVDAYARVLAPLL